MNADELALEVEIQKKLIKEILGEINKLLEGTGDTDPGSVVKTAAASFVCQCYNGVENILKRILRYGEVALPAGDDWHITLLKLFKTTKKKNLLPSLFDGDLYTKINIMRKFRHLVLHGYSFQLEWKHARRALRETPDLMAAVLERIENYILMEKENN